MHFETEDPDEDVVYRRRKSLSAYRPVVLPHQGQGLEQGPSNNDHHSLKLRCTNHIPFAGLPTPGLDFLLVPDDSEGEDEGEERLSVREWGALPVPARRSSPVSSVVVRQPVQTSKLRGSDKKIGFKGRSVRLYPC